MISTYSKSMWHWPSALWMTSLTWNWKNREIIAKIDSDPESEEVKEAEKHLWEKIYKKSGQGRRTGVGITAEGDMLAAMGLRYGTEEATEFSEQVHKTIALEAYRSSVNMAKERGAFAIYDSEREKTIRSSTA